MLIVESCVVPTVREKVSQFGMPIGTRNTQSGGEERELDTIDIPAKFTAIREGLTDIFRMGTVLYNFITVTTHYKRINDLSKYYSSFRRSTREYSTRKERQQILLRVQRIGFLNSCSDTKTNVLVISWFSV